MGVPSFDADAAVAKLATLDAREKLRIELFVNGHTAENIAMMTRKSPVGVKDAIRRTYAKLGIHNKIELEYVMALSVSRRQRRPVA